MANPEHLKRLLNDTAEQWNAWRAKHPNEKPDLSGSDLNEVFMHTPEGVACAMKGGMLSLRDRNLRDASFVATDFRLVEIEGADFTSADVECAWWQDGPL